jgi:hypothetical protein
MPCSFWAVKQRVVVAVVAAMPLQKATLDDLPPRQLEVMIAMVIQIPDELRIRPSMTTCRPPAVTTFLSRKSLETQTIRF